MKKAIVVAILLAFLLAPFLARAQPSPPNVPTLGPVVIVPYSGSSVVIISPENSSDYSNQVQLLFTVQAIGFFGQFGNVGLSVDGGVIYSVTSFINKSVIDTDQQYWLQTTVLANITLPSLSSGIHNATVYYGWQYLGVPANPSLQRYEVFAQATAVFNVVNSGAASVHTVESDVKPKILIISPSNKTFNKKSLPLRFSLNYASPIATNVSVYYSLDGNANTTIFNGYASSLLSGVNLAVPANLTINSLSDGLHNLTVYAQVNYLYFGLSGDHSAIQFSIDTTLPIISGLSISNKTYYQQTIPLHFKINKSTSWLAYDLDNSGNTTIQGNMTLTGLSIGQHSIIIYANDSVGNMGSSKTIYFTIAEPQFPTVTIIAVISTVAIVIGISIGLFIYRKKRKALGD